MIFSVAETLESAEKIQRQSFANLNIWERRHIEEWIRKSPEMLGEELLIVTIEFDSFSQSNDRLDALAIDRAGNLVVIELKRDSLAGYAELQAVRYAAMVSSMTIEKLVPYYRSYRKKYYGEDLNESDAKVRIIQFVTDPESFAQLSDKPRIILCSEGFSREITTSVLWLRSFDVDITCVEIAPYKVGDKIIIVPTVLIPLKTAIAYQVQIKNKEEQREESARTARVDTMRLLLENNFVKEGEIVYLRNGLPAYIQYTDDNTALQAVVTGKLGRTDALRWKKDGQEYSLSGLAWTILKELHPDHKDPGGLSGKWYWENASGQVLGQMERDALQKARS